MAASSTNTTSHTLRQFFDITITLYDNLASTYHKYNDDFGSRVLIDFERGRFWSWGEALGVVGDWFGARRISDQPDVNYDLCREELLKVQDSLRSVGTPTVYESKRSLSNTEVILKVIEASKVRTTGDQTSCSPASSYDSHVLELRTLYHTLQSRNDTLESLLPVSSRIRMEELWPHRNNLATNIGQRSILETISAPQHATMKPRPTAAIKYIGQLRKQQKSGGNKDLFVDNTIDIDSDFGEHSLGWYKYSEGTMTGSTTLVEWKGYDNRWTSNIGRELYNRVSEIAELLHHPEKHGLRFLRVLNCTGWLHDPQGCRFGFVYAIPEIPTSLFTVITTSKTPPLGMKFQLAIMMARCLLDVHSIGWLHKNISSHNIIFSPYHGTMASTSMPYLIGFNHSRLDAEKAFTEGPNYSNKHIEYQHPEYRATDKSTENRFHRIYDYYSLGVVLLEIGLWIPFSRIAEKKAKLSPLELQQYLINDVVPKLDAYMGVFYRDVVASCLKGDFGKSCKEESDEARKETLCIFQSKVVQPLSCCFA